jgi:DNA-binding transcriptional LysR family regulator
VDLLAQMETFVRVVETGSLSAAARRTGLSLAAVSRQIAALEADLGGALLVRTTRKLSITEVGRTFHARCASILAEVDEARRIVRDDRALRGRLVVSAPVSFGIVRSSLLASLLDTHPSLELVLRFEDHVVDLVGDGVDVAIRVGIPPPDSGAYIAHVLGTVRRVLVASPPWLAQHGRPKQPADLGAHPVLLHIPAVGDGRAWLLRSATGEEARVVVAGPLRTNTLAVLRDLAIAGRGIAMLADFVVHDALASGALERVLPAWEGPRATAYALHPVALRRSPRVRAFIEHVRAIL